MLADTRHDSIMIHLPPVLIHEYADGSRDAMHADICATGPSYAT